jgi:ABC-2 type transport system permease protein
VTLTTPNLIPGVPSPVRVFAAMLLRDITVLRLTIGSFLARTLLQPLLLVFVLSYVFPLIGQGVGGENADDFSAVLVAGVAANTILFQGILSVTLPLTHDLGGTLEMVDRVLAPVPVRVLALEKIVAGAVECLLAGLVVFPLAAIIPATDVSLAPSWPVLLTIVPLSCVMSASLGLLLGTLFTPQNTPVLFGVILVPVTFLGGMYFRWTDLQAIPWLQIGSLANPLIYLSEGMRAGVTGGPHMPLAVVYAAVVGATVLFMVLGSTRLARRVVA